MEQNTPTFPNLVRSLDKLNILVFWQILKEHNPLLLDGDYIEHKEYTEEEQDYVVQVWEQLYDSYYQLKKDGKSKKVLEKTYNALMLSNTIQELYTTFRFVKHLDELKKSIPDATYHELYTKMLGTFQKTEPDLPLNYEEPSTYNLAIVQKHLNGLENKYNRLKTENTKEVEEQVDNVFSVIARVSRITQLKLNANNMVVSEWLAYEQQAQEIAKAESDAARNHRTNNRKK